MSRICFHTPDNTAEVHGSERHYFAGLCAEITYGVLRQYAEDEYNRPALLRKAYPPDHYLQAGDFAKKFHTHLIVAHEPVHLRDQEIDLFQLSLNTALAFGSDPLRFAARLHGQCEIHTYVEGPHRAWLAEIIKDGLRLEIYREGQGWNDVIALLEHDDETPVVTSFSVCDGFPNTHVAGWNPSLNEYGEKDWDAWYDLSEETQWNMSMEGVRKVKYLELTPDNWKSYSFGHNLNAVQFINQLRKYTSEAQG